MSIRSILVHLANDEEYMTRLRVAYNLACRHDALLNVVFITNSIQGQVELDGRTISSAYEDEFESITAEKSKTVEYEFQQWCKLHDVRYSWTVMEGEHIKILSKMSLYNDLAIVSQSDPQNLEQMLFAELPDQLAQVGSCPVIVLPHNQRRMVLGRRILIAWNDTVECARAVRSAFPFLQQAESVTLVSRTGGRDAARSLEKVADSLRLHNIEPAVRAPQHGARAAEGRVMEYAKSSRADLIVMGGSGNSRLRELVLGGGTRHMLRSANIPILMSH
jgi:nucleotide-binding universal stress UspA family protein